MANHAGKVIDEENFGEKATVSAYAMYIFHVSVNIDEENFDEWLTICQICQFFPNEIFPCTVNGCPYTTSIATYLFTRQISVLTVASHDQFRL